MIHSSRRHNHQSAAQIGVNCHNRQRKLENGRLETQRGSIQSNFLKMVHCSIMTFSFGGTLRKQPLTV
jgi:hypothetical protein